jgi:hypothetical protein
MSWRSYCTVCVKHEFPLEVNTFGNYPQGDNSVFTMDIIITDTALILGWYSIGTVVGYCGCDFNR